MDMPKFFCFFGLFFFLSCGVHKQLLQETQLSASYQAWVSGVRGGGSGINFYLELKSELPVTVELKRVIFRGFEVPFERQETQHYWAKIKTAPNQQKEQFNDLQIHTSPINTMSLAEHEAVLIFVKNGKEYQQKISNVKEKPTLDYPSAKPKF